MGVTIECSIGASTRVRVQCRMFGGAFSILKMSVVFDMIRIPATDPILQYSLVP